jgi:hypothetical protein
MMCGVQGVARARAGYCGFVFRTSQVATDTADSSSEWDIGRSSVSNKRQSVMYDGLGENISLSSGEQPLGF